MGRIDEESALKALGYKVGLGSKISERSPFTLWLTEIRIHSRSKMDMFYLMLFAALVIVALCLNFGIRPQPTSTTASTASVGVTTCGDHQQKIAEHSLPSSGYHRWN